MNHGFGIGIGLGLDIDLFEKHVLWESNPGASDFGILAWTSGSLEQDA